MKVMKPLVNISIVLAILASIVFLGGYLWKKVKSLKA